MCRAFEEEEASASKRRKDPEEEQKAKKKAKKLTKPTETPLMPDDMYPDVTDDVLAREKEQFEQFVNTAYHPEKLKLEDDEINLKQYLMLGGIYELNFVDKLRHYDFDNDHLNMTWHEHNGYVKIQKDVTIQKFTTTKSISAVSEILKRSTRLTRIAEDFRLTNTAANTIRKSSVQIFQEIAHFKISIQLPPHLCLWELPIACHFIDNVVGYIDHKSEPVMPEHRVMLVPDVPIRKSERHIFQNEEIDTETLTRPSDMNIVLRASSIQSLNALRQTLEIDNDCYIEDFVLDSKLANPQIRNLQRFVVPRILSSYKFPQEIMREMNDDAETRPKKTKKGGVLFRRQASNESVLLSDCIFSHAHQYNPERMFPIFSNVELFVRKVNLLADKQNTTDPDTFFELVDMVDTLSKYTTNGYRKVLRVPAINWKPLKKRKLSKRDIMDSSRHSIKYDLDDDLIENDEVKEKVDEKKTGKAKKGKKKKKGGTIGQMNEEAEKEEVEKKEDKMKKDEDSDDTGSDPEKEMAKDTEDENDSPNENELSDDKDKSQVKKKDKKKGKGKKHGKESFRPKGRKHKLGTTSSYFFSEIEHRQPYNFNHWTTEFIINSHFDAETSTMTISTDRLGIIQFNRILTLTTINSYD